MVLELLDTYDRRQVVEQRDKAIENRSKAWANGRQTRCPLIIFDVLIMRALIRSMSISQT